jgi:hypothetical protein
VNKQGAAALRIDLEAIQTSCSSLHFEQSSKRFINTSNPTSVTSFTMEHLNPDEKANKIRGLHA